MEQRKKNPKAAGGKNGERGWYTFSSVRPDLEKLRSDDGSWMTPQGELSDSAGQAAAGGGKAGKPKKKLGLILGLCGAAVVVAALILLLPRIGGRGSRVPAPDVAIEAPATEEPAAWVVGDWNWSLEDGVLTIFGTGNMRNFESSSLAPWYGSRMRITRLVVSEGITGIGSYAFGYCDNLAAVELPGSVTSIGDGAFGYCGSLTAIKIPDKLASIGRHAFVGCYSLTAIELPESVESLGASVFVDCGSLERIDVNSRNPSYCSVNGVLFSRDGRELICCPAGNGRTAYSVPTGVESIEKDAFRFCSNLTAIELPGSLTSIGDEAFLGCGSLTEIELPESVTSIGDRAFSSCRGLTQIRVDGGNPSFSSAEGVLFSWDGRELICCPAGIGGTEYTIPYGVTRIGDGAFGYCKGLISIEVPDSVTSIGDSAFYSCYGLTDIKIPAGVTSIGRATFSSCQSLTGIEIPESVTSIGDGAFEDCESLTSIKLSSGVTSIEDWAFADCVSLISIELSESVTSIGDRAFSGCISLTDVYFPGTVAQWADISIGTENDLLLKATIHVGETMIDELTAANAQNRYRVTTSDLSWTQARSACWDQKGYLAVISDQEELNQITALADEQGLSYLWIGCHREDDRLIWETGETVDFYRWGSNEPSMMDSYDFEYEDYIMLRKEGNQWFYLDSRDDPADTFPALYSGVMGYVCEWNEFEP